MPDHSQSTTSLAKAAHQTSSTDDDSLINPTNLKESLTNPSISSSPSSARPDITNAPGYRAGEAVVRPSPVSVVGDITHYVFDLKSATFTLSLRAPKEATDEEPTVVFLPEYHFPKDTCMVESSSGKWEISSDDEEGVLVQKLRWWHGAGEQNLKVTGLARKHNVVEGVNDEPGYYELMNSRLNDCSVM